MIMTLDYPDLVAVTAVSRVLMLLAIAVFIAGLVRAATTGRDFVQIGLSGCCLFLGGWFFPRLMRSGFELVAPPHPTPSPTGSPTPTVAPPDIALNINWEASALKVAGFVIAAVIGFLIVRSVARKIIDNAANRTALHQVTRSRLTSGLSRWEAIRDEYGAILIDPVRSLELQALFDLEVDQSRSFHRAWCALDDMARLLVERPEGATIPEETLASLELQAGDAEGLWRSALRNAERIGWTNLAVSDRPRAGKALSLLRTATDPSAGAGERDNAWALAAKILAELNLAHLPTAALSAIEFHARPALAACPQGLR